jgi:hypothetical protein
MKKIEAYQTSDKKKFFEEERAKDHEINLKYRENGEKIKNYLFNLVGIERLDFNEYGETREDGFYDMIEEEPLGPSIGEYGIVEFIVSIITFSDGALLKTAEYAKEMIKFEQFK